MNSQKHGGWLTSFSSEPRHIQVHESLLWHLSSYSWSRILRPCTAFFFLSLVFLVTILCSSALCPISSLTSFSRHLLVLTSVDKLGCGLCFSCLLLQHIQVVSTFLAFTTPTPALWKLTFIGFNRSCNYRNKFRNFPMVFSLVF